MADHLDPLLVETCSKWIKEEFGAAGKLQSPNKVVNFLLEKLMAEGTFAKETLKWPGDARIAKQLGRSSASADFDYRVIDSMITAVRFSQSFLSVTSTGFRTWNPRVGRGITEQI